ncbi:MAG: ABC transporter permease, partial [Acidimicrobiales bacterium]
EGGLSILGAGIDPGPKTMSWGSMITEGYTSLSQHPFPVFVPCAAMFITVFALNYLGDAVRERFDVRESML